MQLVFCGGASEVGASCYFIKMDQKNILLDSGIRMKHGQDVLPSFRRIQELGGVDAIIVSHAHLDHTGSLPIISREYPDARIYMTHATKALTQVLLYDSLKIMDRSEGEIPLYAQKNVEEMLNRIVCYSPQFPFELSEGSLKATFYSAGHVTGAAMIYLQGEEGSLLYTGDFSVGDQQTVKGVSIPKLRPDIVITESTYGQNLHSNRQMEEERLVATVLDVIKRKGKILIPAFALGRAQEVLLVLQRAMAKKQLPEFPIYVDGMVRSINLAYQLNPNYLKAGLAKKIFRGNDVFYNDTITAVKKDEERKEILANKDPLCIIASSGMLKGGPSAFYAEQLAPNPLNFIAITGYQDEEAPGRDVLNLLEDTEAERVLKIDGRTIPLRCGIGRYGLSAHADRGEILGLMQRVTPRQVFLVHGDPANISPLARQMQQEIRGRVHIPVNGEEYDIPVHNPRKQLQLGASITPLHRAIAELNESTITDLWEAVYGSSGIDQGYTAEELLYWWSGQTTPSEQQVRDFVVLLNSASCFVVNTRKLFLYHPLDPEEQKTVRQGMEMNDALAHMRARFPDAAGLYKIGAHQGQRAVVLCFHFPLFAQEVYAQEIAEIPSTTGWTVKLNAQCHLQAAEDLAISLLPRNWGYQKFAYHPSEQCFRLWVMEFPPDADQIEQEFQEKTRMQLLLVSADMAKPRLDFDAILPRTKNKPMEQNQALNYIDEVLRFHAISCYKKGCKRAGDHAYMEITFISPQIAQGYGEIVQSIADDIGWQLVVGKNPNQNEIVKVMNTLCAKLGISLKRTPRIFIAEARVGIETQMAVEPAILAQLAQEFQQITGYTVSDA